MDFKFDDRPNVIWGETACLALRQRDQGSHFLLHMNSQYYSIYVDIKYYVTFNNHPPRRCGQPIKLYWLLLLLSRPVRFALFKLYTLLVL